MRTIFGLFTNYDDADIAVKELLANGFREDEMNAIAQDYVVKGHMEVSLSDINIAKSAESVIEKPQGLDRIFGGRQVLIIADAGSVYAAGTLAVSMAKTALNPKSAGVGLKPVLVGDFRFLEETADKCIQGLRTGKVLFFMRVDDEKSFEVAKIINFYKGESVGSYS